MVEQIGLVIVCIWLVGITVLLYQIRISYSKLISHTGARSIDDALRIIVKNDQEFGKLLQECRTDLDTVKAKSASMICNVGVIRYDPFERIGGEQSYAVALLDDQKTGILLNFLYTREGLRMFARTVKNGKSDQADLSDEEKQAIAQALHV